MVFPFNRTELLRKLKDNSSVTRFACATFPTREGKAAAPGHVIAFPVTHTPSSSLLSQCRIPLLCHCEPVRTLVWQSRTKYHPFSSWGEKIPTAVCALPRNDKNSVIAFPVRTLVWQSPGYLDCPKGMPLGAILVLLQPERAFHSFCLPHGNNIQKLPVFPRKLILPFPEKGLTPVFGYVIVIN